MLRNWRSKLGAALPSQCAICRAWPARPVCDDCASRFLILKNRCQTCAIEIPEPQSQCGRCLAHKPPLDRCLAAVSYAYPWAGCIASFKFQERPGWANILSTLMLSTPWVEPEIEQSDWVIPMPLSPRKLSQRGFNQALELARHLSPGKTRPDLLLRIRDTASQSSLKRSARQTNVRGAFAVEPSNMALLQQSSVLLVDDVMTSGASLHEAATTLRKAGARRVSAVVLARTPHGI